MSDLDEAAADVWLQRLRAGGTESGLAIEQLRSYLIRGLQKSLSHRYGGRVQAEDIAQVALLKIINSLASFQGRSRFETWAMAIAIRVGISELRKRHYRDISIDLSSGGDQIHIGLADTASRSEEQQAQRQQLMILLQRLIDEALSDKQRMAIRGLLAGLPVEEIAARLQSKRNAIYKLQHDARLKLRRAFEASGLTAEDISALIS